MGQFMLRRTLYAIVTLFILSLTIFTVVRLTGDPVTLLAEPGARAEDLDRIRAEWGLDRSWPVQYLTFAKNVFTGELGKSFNYEMPVSTLYFQRLPNSLELALAATLISFVIGIPAGVISAGRVKTAWGSVGKIIALFGLAGPGFWLGLGMILILSVWLGWLPTSGQGGWQHLIMPAVALGWYFAASLLRLSRSSMLEVLRSEYIKLARLKGLPGYAVIAIHAFKNALIPVLTLAGINLVVMLNAAEIIEVIFVPLDDVVDPLIQKYGNVSQACEYLGKIKGHWMAVPTCYGSAAGPSCARIDLFKEYVGLDVQKMYPAGPPDEALTNQWTWDYLLTASEKCMKAGKPFGIGLSTCTDAINMAGSVFTSFGADLVDAEGTITVKTDATRRVLKWFLKLSKTLPDSVYAYDNASNNKALISGQSALIFNAPSAYAVARRDNIKVAEQCWTFPSPKGPKGRFDNSQYY